MAPTLELLQANELAMSYLAALPPVLREDPDYQAIMYCFAKGYAEVEERILDVRAQVNPLTATEVGLPLWETLLRLPAAGGDPVAVRRSAVVNRLQTLRGDPSARAWLARMNARMGSAPWTFLEYVPVRFRNNNLIADQGMTAWTGAVTAGGTLDGVTNAATTPDSDPDPATRLRATNGTGVLRYAVVQEPVNFSVRRGLLYTGSADIYVADTPAAGAGAGIIADFLWFDINGAVAGNPHSVPVVVANGARTRVSLSALPPANAVSGRSRFGIGFLTAADTIDVYVQRARTTVGDETTYKNGDTSGWDWAGTSGASISYEASGPDPQHLQIALPFDIGSAAWDTAIAMFEAETPSEIVLDFITSDVFTWDVSQWDVDAWGA